MDKTDQMQTTMRRTGKWLMLAWFGILGEGAHAQTAGMLSFQGVIKDANGDLVNGPVDLEFRIFDAQTAGSQGAGPFGPYPATAVGGVVSTKFGPVQASSFNGDPRWLEVRVNGSALPRVEMATAPASAEQLTHFDSGIPVITSRNSEIRFRENSNANLVLNYDAGSKGAVEAEYTAAPGHHVRIDFTDSTQDWWTRLGQEPNGGNFIIDYRGSGAFVVANSSGDAFHINGNTTNVKILAISGGSDLAEPFEVGAAPDAREGIESGMVLVIDPNNPGQLKLASEPYDRKVVGIISGANGLSPGMVMKAEGHRHAEREHNVALTGRVWCWCDATYAAVEPGDRLTTSSTPGYAMKVTDRDRADGAVIGKAMTRLETGTGLVLVLVQPQ